jgi:hypothetical protein
MRTKRLVGRAVLVIVVVVVGASKAGSAPAGCSQLNKLPSLFPAAKTVGFTKRSVITRWAGRQPIWAGWCQHRWWRATYSGTHGSVDVGIALYATAHGVIAALAEPAYGAVQVQPNGARMRHTSRATDTGTTPGVVSAYRNLFVSSYSGYEPGSRRVPIAVQWRIHRAIDTAFRALTTTTKRRPTRVTIVAPRLAQSGDFVRVNGTALAPGSGKTYVTAPALFRVSESGSTIRKKIIRIHEGHFRTWTRFSKPGVYRVSVSYPGDKWRLPASASVMIQVT